MATPSPLYFAMQPLQQCIFDKDDGTALAAGIVSYFSDPAFSVPKNIYEQVNAPDGTYSYANIGSVVTLSSIGSFVDDNGQNFIPFAFPWSHDTPSPDTANPGAFQPYYITVYSAGGVLQFTVTGWPANSFSEGGGSSGIISSQNILTNPQFAEVIFPAAPDSTTLSVSGTQTIAIAPAWDLITSGTGSVILTQEALVQETPSKAPYSLDIDLGSGVSAVLRQRIQMSPRLLASSNLAAYFEAASTAAPHPSIDLVLAYTPSGGTQATDLIDATVSTGTYMAFTAVIPLSGVINPNSPLTGYVDITLTIPDGVKVAVTSFQIIGAASTAVTVVFEQQSVPLQQSQLFWYWQPALNYKPIPSYLEGWDFPLNPTLANGSTVASIPVINSSYYVWDQTILFQTASSGIATSRDTATGGITLTRGSNDSSFALIQYLPQTKARQILAQRNAVQLKGFTGTASTTLRGTVSLYYTIDAQLPDLSGHMGSQNSLVSSITAAVPTVGGGSPHGNWTIVPRDTLGNTPSFTLTHTSTAFSFSQWESALAARTTATYFAIVIAFDTLTTAIGSVTLEYAGLMGGDIATRPAPQSYNAVLQDCGYYYQSSFPPGVVPATGVGSNPSAGFQATGASQSALGPIVRLPYPLRKVDITYPGGSVSLFSPVNASDQIYNSTTGLDWGTSVATNTGETGFVTTGVTTAGSISGNACFVNWTIDGRLGVIL